MKLICTLLILSFLGVRSTDACSVAPLDPIAEKNDLTVQVLNRIGVSIDNATGVQIDDYAGEYIWTPMCPKGYKSEAKLTVSFIDVNDPLTKGCTTIVKVYKSYIYEDGMFSYTFNDIQAATCLE